MDCYACELYNLRIVETFITNLLSGPKVSAIERFHCMHVCIRNCVGVHVCMSAGVHAFRYCVYIVPQGNSSH